MSKYKVGSFQSFLSADGYRLRGQVVVAEWLGLAFHTNYQIITPYNGSHNVPEPEVGPQYDDAVKTIPHVDYPHWPGYVYDCPACERECHCMKGHAECVFDGHHNGEARR